MSSAGREAVDLAEMAGLNLDPWQRLVLEEALGECEEVYWNEILEAERRKWAALEVGLVVGRQNGKGAILEARELAGLFLLGERLIIHSAHQFDTSLEAFQRILFLIENTPDLDREVFRVSRSHGEEGIELKSGQRLRFRTRTKGGGRGFTCDCLILDEAMYLGAPMVGALLPTLSARPAPQIWYTGSAGDKESTQLGRVRARALGGNDPALCYLEWSINACDHFCDPRVRDYECPEHDAVNTEESYAKANPGYGIRISREFIENEFRSMELGTFKRERLSVGDWPTEGEKWLVIGEDAWMSRIDRAREPQTPFVFAIHVSPDRKYGCISVAGEDGEGGLCVEITGREQSDFRPGTKWILERAKELNRTWKPAAFIVHKGSQAGSLVDDLERAKIPVESPTSREYAQACGKFYSGIVPSENNDPWIWHRNQMPLTAAVQACSKRASAGLWAWDAQSSAVPVTPLECATLAMWGHGKFANRVQAAAPWAVYA